MICYAMKANSNQAVIRTMAELGAGMDVCRRANCAGRSLPGFRRARWCSPVWARRRARWRWRCAKGSRASTSKSETRTRASVRGGEARGPARHRVDPRQSGRRCKDASQDLDGKAEDKFGISYKRAREVYARATALPAIDVAGIDMHIGSQITELEPFEKAFR